MLTFKLKLATGVLLAGVLAGARLLTQTDAVAADAKAPVADAKNDAHGDPLPAGAVMRLGTLRWRHSTAVMHVGYLGEGREVLSVSQDGAIRVWEQATGKELRKFGKISAFNPNMGFPGGFGQLDLAVPEGGGAMPGRGFFQPQGLSCAVLSEDRKTVATGYQDGTITVWDVAAAKEIRSFRWNGSPIPAGDKDPKPAPGKPVMPGYIGGVQMLVLSADARHLVARCPDGSNRVFTTADGKELSKFTPQNPNRVGRQQKFFNWAYTPSSMAITPDGKLAKVVGFEVEQLKNNNSNRQTVVIKTWDTATGKEQAEVRGPQVENGGFSMWAISPDATVGAFFQFGQPGTLHLWDLGAGKELKKVPADQNFYPFMVGFAPGGKTLAMRSQMDDSLRVVDVAAGKQTKVLGEVSNTGMGAGQSNVAFSPDGKHVAVGTLGNIVRQYDVAAGKELAEKSSGHHGSVVALAVSPDGKSIVTRGSNNTVHVWDAATGNESKRFGLPVGSYFAAFSSDGSLLAVGSQDFQKGATESKVSVWNVKEGKELKSWVAGQNGFTSLAISPDGKTVAVRDGTNAVKLWDAAKGTEMKTVVAAPMNNGDPNVGIAIAIAPGFFQPISQNLVFSPDSTLLAGVAGDMNNGGPVPLPANDKDRAVAPPAGAPSLRIWDVASGKMLRRFDPPKNNGISSFAFSADGRTIAALNYDSSISLWEAASGKERFNFRVVAQGVKPIDKGVPPALPPQPAPAPGVDKAQAVEPFLRVAPFPGMPAGPTINCLVYAPDSRYLATGGSDGLVRFWDVATGKEISQLKGHTGSVVSLAFAANGKRLVSGSADTTALVWDAPTVAGAMANAEMDATRADALWADLVSNDAAKAYQAIVAFRATPKTTVPYLKERIRAVPAPDAKKLDQLIVDLDSNQFAVRMRANDELEKMGKAAKGALDQAMAAGPNLEMRQRLERLLEKLVTGAAPPPEQVRVHRSLEVLEWIGSTPAQDVLQTVAKGAAGADVTVDAKASLDRLGKR